MATQISGKQVTAARSLAGLTAAELAERAGLSRDTIMKIEAGTVQPREGTVSDITNALASVGVEFVGNVGVQWIQHQVKTLTGVEGLKTFFDDVRAVAKEDEEEIVIFGFDEDYFEEKLGDYLDYHRDEMTKFGNVKMRCLIEESDPNLGASDYCQYRWHPKGTFSNVPFYVYGDRLAIIVTSGPEDPLVLIIHNRTIADAYRRQFEPMWAAAKEPSKKGIKDGRSAKTKA